MGIDIDDVKILIHSSLQLLFKSCWKYVKDQPIISVFLLVFLFFYLFLPSLFYILFYTSPLVICAAVLLQGRIHFRHQNMGEMKRDDESDKTTVETRSSPREPVAPRRKLRPAIKAAMSRRTYKKQACEQLETVLVEDLKVDFILKSFSDLMPVKLQEKKVVCGSKDDKAEAGKLVDPASSAVKIDGPSKCIEEPQKENKVEAELQLKKEKNKLVGELTEEDQRNQMDLGSSDIEKRLESLMAKRRAKKTFSMLPERTHVNSVVNDFQGHTPLAPLLIDRINSDIDGGGQPGSAPSLLLPKNPFDLPYDPSEEKPVLTGDGFEDEFLVTQPKEIHFRRHESFAYGSSFPAGRLPDPPFRSKFSVFTNPITSTTVGTGLPTKLRRPTDPIEDFKHVSEQSSQESELSREEQLKTMKSNPHEEANISDKKGDDSSMLLESVDATKEQGLDSEQEDRQDTSSSVGSIVSIRDEPEVNPDLIEDDNDETSSSSSIEEDNTDIAIDVPGAVKNENFRNSVKKVLSVIQKRGAPPLYPSPAIDRSNDSNPRSVTKMEERSFYTRPTHHLSYSIASDMQVEVSDGPNSPTDVESLAFGQDDDDQDEDDQDEDDTDMDSQGTSIESAILEGSGTRSKAPLIDYPTSGRSEGSKTNSTSSQDTTIDPSNAEQQYITQDTDFGSSSDSTSPVTHQDSIIQQVSRDSGTSSTKRLQDNTLMVGSASTSTEQNIDTYIHLPSDVLPREDRDQSLHASISRSIESELVAQPDVLDLSSSPRSVLQESIAMDDEGSRHSEHNIEPNNLSGPTPPSIHRGSNTGSSSSSKSVLPVTTAVHEFGSNHEHRISTDNNEDHRDEVESSSLSDAPQDQQTETPDGDSISTTSSVNTFSPRSKIPLDSPHLPVASPSSDDVAPPQTVPRDEMALKSGDSIHSHIQPFDGVMVSRIPLKDLPLVEDEVGQASTSKEKDQNEEKPRE